MAASFACGRLIPSSGPEAVSIFILVRVGPPRQPLARGASVTDVFVRHAGAPGGRRGADGPERYRTAAVTPAGAPVALAPQAAPLPRGESPPRAVTRMRLQVPESPGGPHEILPGPTPQPPRPPGPGGRLQLLPPGHHPHGVLVDRKGMVWTTGNGNGTIGRLDPASGEFRKFPTLSHGGGPHTLVISEDGGTIWFTEQSGNRIGRLDTASGKIIEYPTSGGPYGIALDKAGAVWFCRMGDDRLGILDPATGAMAELALPAGSRPRRMAAAPDGSLWVTLYGRGKLAQIDPAARRVLREIALPAGPKCGPYAVTVDGAGIVWANEIDTDTVVRLDPGSGDLRVIQLPSKGVGIRKMIVDARGQLWYMGSHNGRLGVVK